jgi:hypothetical protein
MEGFRQEGTAFDREGITIPFPQQSVRVIQASSGA